MGMKARSTRPMRLLLLLEYAGGQLRVVGSGVVVGWEIDSAQPFLDPAGSPGGRKLFGGGIPTADDRGHFVIHRENHRHGETVARAKIGEPAQAPAEKLSEFESPDNRFSSLHHFAVAFHLRSSSAVETHLVNLCFGSSISCSFSIKVGEACGQSICSCLLRLGPQKNALKQPLCRGA